jgi:hypothetical protein
MNNKSKIAIIIGGGLIVLLFFLLSVKNMALISFENNQYIIETKKYFQFSPTKKQINFPEFKLEESWYIEEVIEGDFDNDGDIDVGIYLWKHGNYGKALPFWEEANDDSYRQHLFLFEKNGDSVWHSSNLPYHNLQTILADINNDGQNELIVLEKPYKGYKTTIAVWKWDEWGFKNLWRSEPGNYYNLELKLNYVNRVT